MASFFFFRNVQESVRVSPVRGPNGTLSTFLFGDIPRWLCSYLITYDTSSAALLANLFSFLFLLLLLRHTVSYFGSAVKGVG